MNSDQNKVRVKVVSLKNHNLTSLDQVSIDSNCNALDLSNNPIKELGILGEFSDLMYLLCRNTLISSFRGSPFQSPIANASFENSPISDQPNFKLNATIAFGPSLTLLNGEYISPQDRKYAQIFSSSIRSFLFEGFLIERVTETSNTYIVELVNIYTKKKKTVNIPLSPTKKEVILLLKNQVKVPIYYPMDHDKQLKKHEKSLEHLSPVKPYYPPPFPNAYLLQH